MVERILISRNQMIRISRKVNAFYLLSDFPLRIFMAILMTSGIGKFTLPAFSIMDNNSFDK